jgi:putative transposase
MPNYRRAFQPGGTFFFTVVTVGRTGILTSENARRWLHEAFAECGAARPFVQVASVLLPEHLHELWTLPTGDSDYSTRWRQIKTAFTRRYLDGDGVEQAVTADHHEQGRRGVWQPRFYEHTIRDETDLNNHLDYIHYNPVKHGLVTCPHLWPWSSFHRFVREGKYEPGWACACGGETVKPPNFEWASPDME